jgi:hypothetical protein
MKNRELQFAQMELVESTNSLLNMDVVHKIVDEGWVFEKGLALPAWWNGEKFIITDGNHRLEALKHLGEKFVPIVQLTKKEFDYVKYSTRHVDFAMSVPEKVRAWTTEDTPQSQFEDAPCPSA